MMCTEFNWRKIGQTCGFYGNGHVNFGFFDDKDFLKEVVDYELYKRVPNIVGISLQAVLYTSVEQTLPFWFFPSRVKNVCGVPIS
jgi:hypothetical protein